MNKNLPDSNNQFHSNETESRTADTRTMFIEE